MFYANIQCKIIVSEACFNLTEDKGQYLYYGYTMEATLEDI